MKKILVTGGAGFLGSHLCDRLIAQGHQVVCLDSFFTGSERNIAGLMGNPAFTLMHHDVVDPVRIEGLDEIYNLACPASPVHYQYDPIHTMKTSVLGALNMLELARATGAKVFQASTSEVYGDPTVHPQNPIGATSTRSASAVAMTRASARPRRCSSIISAHTICGSRSCAFSIPMVRAWRQTTGAW